MPRILGHQFLKFAVKNLLQFKFCILHSLVIERKVKESYLSFYFVCYIYLLFFFYGKEKMMSNKNYGTVK